MILKHASVIVRLDTYSRCARLCARNSRPRMSPLIDRSPARLRCVHVRECLSVLTCALRGWQVVRHVPCGRALLGSVEAVSCGGDSSERQRRRRAVTHAVVPLALVLFAGDGLCSWWLACGGLHCW